MNRRVAFLKPCDDLLGHSHRGEPALAHQGPIVEQMAGFHFGKRSWRVQVMEKAEIYDGGFRVLRVGARLADDLREADNPGFAAAMVDENTVFRPHGADGLQGLRALNAVPGCGLVALQIGDGIGGGLGFGKKVVHKIDLNPDLALNGCGTL